MSRKSFICSIFIDERLSIGFDCCAQLLDRIFTWKTDDNSKFISKLEHCDAILIHRIIHWYYLINILLIKKFSPTKNTFSTENVCHKFLLVKWIYVYKYYTLYKRMCVIYMYVLVHTIIQTLSGHIFNIYTKQSVCDVENLKESEKNLFFIFVIFLIYHVCHVNLFECGNMTP